MMLCFEQYRYKFIPFDKNDVFRVLEVGIGNDSPNKFKALFPNSVYHGIDKDLNYNLSEKSIHVMKDFYQINLERDSLEKIPDDFFDYVIIAHVIEHIHNGEEVIRELTGEIMLRGKKCVLIFH